MSLQREAELRFCGSMGALASVDIPTGDRLGVVTRSERLQELGVGLWPAAGTHREKKQRMDKGELRIHQIRMARGSIQSLGATGSCIEPASRPIAE